MFEELDKDFAEFASLLKFRDKEKDRKNLSLSKERGTLSKEDLEMEEWDKEMKVRLADALMQLDFENIHCQNGSISSSCYL